MTKARDIADFKFENITDTGTEGTKVASGTTAQRGSTTGQWRYNSSTGFFEGRNANEFSTLEPTPTVTSVDVTEVDSQAGGNQTIVVTGTNFTSGGVIAFVGSSAQFNANTTTFNNATQVTAVAPKASFLNAQEPYKIKFTSSSGVAGSSATGLINVDSAPTWTTNAGSLGSINENATGNHFTVSATDADSDTVAYSLQSGSLGGLSLNSSTGVISGDPTNVSSNTTNNFTLRATAGGKTADRDFSYITTNVPTYAQLSGSGTWSVPSGVTSAEILIVAGGASGSRSPNVGGGGGGAGGIVHRSSYTFTSSDISSGIAYSVGAGGDGIGISPYAYDGGYNSGGDTTFAISGGTITAKGGGGGGGYGGSSPHLSGFTTAYYSAETGGSGGGGAWDNLTGGSSNQGTFSGWTSYGNSGGNGQTGNSEGGAGGGGAGSAGSNVSSSAGTSGGNGQLFSNFTSYGASGYFGGGGGGGGSSSGSATHGGGAGGNTSSYSGSNATDTTGGGGGGSKNNGYGTYNYKSGDGGNGTILIRY